RHRQEGGQLGREAEQREREGEREGEGERQQRPPPPPDGVLRGRDRGGGRGHPSGGLQLAGDALTVAPEPVPRYDEEHHEEERRERRDDDEDAPAGLRLEG